MADAQLSDELRPDVMGATETKLRAFEVETKYSVVESERTISFVNKGPQYL